MDGWMDNYFRELTYMITRAGKSEICIVGQQTGNSGAVLCLEAEFPLLQGHLSFVLRTFQLIGRDLPRLSKIMVFT